MPQLWFFLRHSDRRKKAKFFDRLESISEHFDNVGEDNVLQMLNDIVAELEKED